MRTFVVPFLFCAFSTAFAGEPTPKAEVDAFSVEDLDLKDPFARTKSTSSAAVVKVEELKDPFAGETIEPTPTKDDAPLVIAKVDLVEVF